MSKITLGNNSKNMGDSAQKAIVNEQSRFGVKGSKSKKTKPIKTTGGF
jgi:hypothetical protein